LVSAVHGIGRQFVLYQVRVEHSSRHNAQRPGREAVTTDCTQQLWAETLLIFTKQGEDAGHAADSGADLSEKFGLCARAKSVQVPGAVLQA
jgi:hypothetical protein